jgi:hypothetical protein
VQACGFSQDIQASLQPTNGVKNVIRRAGTAARLLRHSQVDAHWGAWATRTLSFAPLPFFAHAAVFVFFRDRPEYPLVAIGVTLVTVAVMLYSLFFGQLASMRVIPPGERRRLRSSWLGNFIGMILVPLTIPRMTHPTTPEEWFVIYALWLIEGGCTYFSQAADLGILYVTASLCYLLAVLASFVPFYIQLVTGSSISLNMTTLGLLLRRVARVAASR